jgi:hypothetical protein
LGLDGVSCSETLGYFWREPERQLMVQKELRLTNLLGLSGCVGSEASLCFFLPRIGYNFIRQDLFWGYNFIFT